MIGQDRGIKIIENYLERVRSYIPLVDESYILELRTHILQEAERLGGGEITEGSALLAVEHMGDPKIVANEYAGSGEKIGPIPVEYYRPFIALVIVFTTIGLSISAGWYLLAQLFPDVTFRLSGPVLVAIVIISSVGLALLVVERLNVIDIRSSSSERTLFERFIGIGADALRKKSRTAILEQIIGGVVLCALLMFPQVLILFTETVLPFVPLVIGVTFFTVIVGVLYYRYEERPLVLFLDMIGSALVVVTGLLLIAIFPFARFYVIDEGIIHLYEVGTVFADYPDAFALLYGLWVLFLVFVIIKNIWHVLIYATKFSYYVREGPDTGVYVHGQ